MPASAALIAICVAYFMVILDATVVNVALPALGRALGATTIGLQWVIDAYSLVFAASLLSAGALSDRQGAKRVFQAGIALFTASSLGCGLAPSAAALVVARCTQGLGASLAVPASLALLQAAFPDQAARRRAFGIWGGIAGVAAGAGPVAGGVLVSAFGWRAVFFVNVPIGIAGMLLGRRWLPSPARQAHAIDLAGQTLGATALGALTAAVIEAGRLGWWSPLPLGGLIVFALAGTAFVAVEHRATAPMLPISLYSSPAFSSASAVGLLLNLGFYGELFVLSLYLQQLHHFSVLAAGAALLPMAAMATFGSTASGRGMARSGPRLPMLAGLCTGAAGFLALAAVTGPQRPYWQAVLPLAAVGFGTSFTMPAATAAVMEAAPSARGGLASGTINAARQAGGVIGVALLGSLVAGHSAFVPGLHLGLAISAGAFGLGALATALGVGRRRVPVAPAPTRRAGQRCE